MSCAYDIIYKLYDILYDIFIDSACFKCRPGPVQMQPVQMNPMQALLVPYVCLSVCPGIKIGPVPG